MQKIELNGETYIKESDVKDRKTSGRVIVRCRNAGVHVGTLKSRDAVNTILANANRIWRWRGANTLNEVANNGVNRNEYTRISEEVEVLTLTTSDTCEVINVLDGVDLTEVWND